VTASGGNAAERSQEAPYTRMLSGSEEVPRPHALLADWQALKTVVESH
jgi:hypothetical protein